MQINHKRLNKSVFYSNLLSRSTPCRKLRYSADEHPSSNISFNSWLSFNFVNESLFCTVDNDCANSILFEQDVRGLFLPIESKENKLELYI